VPRLLAVLLAIAPLNAQLLVDIYAGGVIRTGVPANDVPLGDITGVTWDPSGNIVFTDSTHNVIRRVAPNGIITTIAGTGVVGFAGDGGPATSALLYSPSNPQYDAAGNLYFFDSLNVRIRRVDTHGIITTIAGDGEFLVGGLDIVGPATSRSLPDPLSFAVDQSGTLYIVEPASNNILRLTPAGDLEMFAQVAVPTGVAVDGAGNVYVSSAASPFASIQRVSPNGTVTTFAIFTSGPDLYSLALGSTDAAGNLYVLFNNQLFRYAPDGTNTALPIPPGSSYPLSSDPQGDLAFASTIVPDAYVEIPVIQEFSAQSVLTTVAGGAPQPAPDGTPLNQAWFLEPRSIAFSHTGDMYIAEFGACLIRKISAAGILSTFAGTGKCGYPSPSGTAKTADLVYPGSIAIDSQDNVWVADDFLNLYSISQQGVLSAMIKTPVAGGTGQLAIDAQDRIYVLGGESLYRVLSDGASQNLGAFPTYEGIGADSSGNVYFSEDAPSNTYVVNNDGSVTLKYPGFSANSLAFDPAGNIWGNTGELTTDNVSGIANIGVYGSFGSNNGPAQSANLAGGPTAFGPDGNLYLAGDPILRVTGSGPATPPVISQGGIVNAISYAGASLAPGEIVSIFGSNFGASSLVVNAVVNNTVPSAIGRTKVLFNGAPGPITAITPNQVNVFVPYELTPGATVNVQVQVDNILSAPVSMPVAQTAPGLSPSILNQDGTVNTSANPAPRGSIASFYGTGLGLTTPQLNDGNIALSTPYSTPLNPPAISIGGQQAVIQYAGDAPTLPTGIFQINATIPTTINAGPTLVSLGTSQVTVFVK
jgi:uncharacterized protein (TIGR03437 family)